MLVQPHDGLAPNGEWWICQSWAIIDPAVTGGGQEILNYLLPLHQATLNVNGSSNTNWIEISDLFCSGHCWTPEGDLVVAGGGSLIWHNEPGPTNWVEGAPSGAKWLFLFDPAGASQSWQGLPSLYSGQEGRWKESLPGLLIDRWYPTVTLSQSITRGAPPLNHEVVMVSGGSNIVSGTDINSYETWVPRGFAASPLPFLAQDNDPSPLAVVEGPNSNSPTSAAPHEEELSEYPRTHLLSTGELFKSGPTQHGAATDLNVPAVAGAIHRRPWDIRGDAWKAVAGWTPWTNERHDGASLFLARFNGMQDIVVRLGGAQFFNGPSTSTAEFCIASAANSPSGSVEWQPLPGGVDQQIPGGLRNFPNAVVLPDGSIVVIGGADTGAGTYTSSTALWRLGAGWVDTGAHTPTRRAYHATAVLLPDGRVLVGGGERVLPASPIPGSPGERDYDIYVPHYLQAVLEGAATRPSIVDVTDAAGASLPAASDGTTILDRQGPSSFLVTCEDLEALDSVADLVLMAPGSITHHSDMSARYVQLPSSPSGEANQRLFVLPDANVVPRGFYMLFALNSSGIPSVAWWVKVQ